MSITVKELVSIEFPVVIFNSEFQQIFKSIEQVAEFFDEQLLKNDVEDSESTQFFSNLLKELYVEELYTFLKREFEAEFFKLFENNNFVFRRFGCLGFDYIMPSDEIFVDGYVWKETNGSNVDNYFEDFLSDMGETLTFVDWIKNNFITFNSESEFEEYKQK